MPPLADGELLVKTLYLSVDPTQRGWMAGDTYLPAIPLGAVVRSLGVGQVLESNTRGSRQASSYRVVLAGRTSCRATAAESFPSVAAASGVDAAQIPLAMSVLGLTGITAYFGLLEVGRPQAGETVVVSGAAGATGSVVGQIARIKGCRTIGIAGGPDKCAWLTREAGFDAAIDYKAEDVFRRLWRCAQRNRRVLRQRGRRHPRRGPRQPGHARSGRALRRDRQVQRQGAPPGPRNYLSLLVKRGRMEGFIVIDYMKRAGEAVTALSQWVREGRIKHEEDIQVGLENAPATLLRLFDGRNRGKQLLKVADPPLPVVA